MFSEEACRTIRLVLAYGIIIVLLVMDWFHPGAAKDFDVVLPGVIAAYHLGEYYTRKQDNEN